MARARGRLVIKDIDLGWAEMMRVATKRPIEVTIGVHDTDANRTGDGGDIDNVTLMTIHEFGNDTNPERSVIRDAWDENLPTYIQMAKGFWGAILELVITREDAIQVVGRKVLSDFVTKIQDGPFIANTPETITAKGSSQPLIDSWQLADAFEFEVRAS